MSEEDVIKATRSFMGHTPRPERKITAEEVSKKTTIGELVNEIDMMFKEDFDHPDAFLARSFLVVKNSLLVVRNSLLQIQTQHDQLQAHYIQLAKEKRQAQWFAVAALAALFIGVLLRYA